MKPRLVIIECAECVFRQLFLPRLHNHIPIVTSAKNSNIKTVYADVNYIVFTVYGIQGLRVYGKQGFK